MERKEIKKECRELDEKLILAYAEVDSLKIRLKALRTLCKHPDTQKSHSGYEVEYICQDCGLTY